MTDREFDARERNLIFRAWLAKHDVAVLLQDLTHIRSYGVGYPRYRAAAQIRAELRRRGFRT